jgi:coenzyme F420-dependent glucose-6-phosphate dehydrogenase
VPLFKIEPRRRSGVRIGYSLSSEEHSAPTLVGLACRAEAAGFDYASISDHFHPWIDAQGQSPFAWGVLGAIAARTNDLVLGTGVTCPTHRYHPAVVAQAAATVASLAPGRFFLGLGTGEWLNEHVVGGRWAPYATRAAMLSEGVEVIRSLWTGAQVNYHGDHVAVENARLYSLPDESPPIILAAGGPKAADLAGRIGDGLICAAPQTELVTRYREAAASPGPRFLQISVCWDQDETEARRIAHKLCPSVALKGELGNLLATPKQYEQAVQMVSESDVAEVITCGPDVDRHVAAVQRGIDAGFDRIHVYQVGTQQEGFFRFYEREVLPRL